MSKISSSDLHTIRHLSWIVLLLAICSSEALIAQSTLGLRRSITPLGDRVFSVVTVPDSSEGPKIGAPRDGITYRVESSTTTTRADAARCGYNDLSLPNTAIYRVEQRTYEEVKDGRVVRTWTETAESFERCYEP